MLYGFTLGVIFYNIHIYVFIINLNKNWCMPARLSDFYTFRTHIMEVYCVKSYSV